jgi:glycosyltransferase involved in cell wall biosynthesis
MAALEALASGRPVIATNAGGPATIITHGVDGLLTAPDDAAELAENLTKILTNAHLAHQLGIAGRARAERYGWSNIGCDILDVYRSLIRTATVHHACAS